MRTWPAPTQLQYRGWGAPGGQHTPTYVSRARRRTRIPGHLPSLSRCTITPRMGQGNTRQRDEQHSVFVLQHALSGGSVWTCDGGHRE